MRIRANALTGAVEKKEWMLRHLDGGYLVADGLTEQLAGTLRERLIKELLLRDGREAAVKKMCLKRLNPDVHDRIAKAAGLIVAAVALQGVADTEEAKGDDDGRSFLILIVVLVLIAGYIIGDAIKRYMGLRLSGGCWAPRTL